MWQIPRTEGFVELEQTFVRLLKKTDDKKWLCKTLATEDGNPWASLQKEIPQFFQPEIQLNFIVSDQGGVRSFDYPQDATEAEIKKNLQLKRSEFFNSKEELLFSLKLRMARPDKTREVIVSWLPASLLEQAQRLCIETGFAIGRLTTSLDATFGAFQRQLQTPPQETAIVLKIGYSHVHLAAIRGQEIVTMRSLLTGSIRELENLLFSGFSLPREEVWMMLDGIKQIEIPAITEAVKTNRLELMTHIGSLFSELRSKKLLSDKSMLYLSNSCVEEPELGQMITERFAIRVESLTGMQNDELSVTPEDKKAVWLSGASQLSVANMVPPVSRRTIHLTLPARLSAIAAILLAVAPLPFLNVVKLKSARQLEATQAKHVATQQLVDDFAKASKEQETLVTLAKEITSDIDKRGLATNLTRHLTEKLPPFSRLERIEVNLKDSKLMITGYTVDTETALRYLDAVKLFSELGEPEITIGDLDSRRIRFDITAPIGKKG